MFKIPKHKSITNEKVMKSNEKKNQYFDHVVRAAKLQKNVMEGSGPRKSWIGEVRVLMGRGLVECNRGVLD